MKTKRVFLLLSLLLSFALGMRAQNVVNIYQIDGTGCLENTHQDQWGKSSITSATAQLPKQNHK